MAIAMNRHTTKLNLSRETVAALAAVSATQKAQVPGVACDTGSITTERASAAC
jgi:hypothetical protein